MPHAAAPMIEEMRRCAQECLGCYSSCIETVHHCLRKGGKHAEHAHIAVLLACAEVCRASANTLLLGAEVHASTCRACAEVCRACEMTCRAMSDGDRDMERCADVCARCAESCERMAGSH